MPPELNAVLSYVNPRVIERYKKDFPNNTISAEEAFREILKFFWLTQKHQHDKQLQPDNAALEFDCTIHLEMTEIDDMWHTFILFTRDYEAFCHQYFGKFFHHEPASPDQKIAPEVFEISFTRYLNYIYDNLGQETVETWFAELLKEEND